jgi:hypothetical protein
MQQVSGISNEFFKGLCSGMVAADIPWYVQTPSAKVSFILGKVLQ